MPKVKPIQLTNFFEGHRRKAFLVAWTHLKTKAGESRVKLDLRLPLLNQTMQGMNEAIYQPYALMEKDDTRLGRTNLNIEMAGMTLECFTTADPAESKSPIVSSNGVKFVKFALSPEGEGEKREVNLSIVAYIPASFALRDWAWNHLHQDFGIEAVYSQSEMEFGDDDPDEIEEDEEQDEAEKDSEDDEPVLVGADNPSSDKPGENWEKPLSDSAAKRIRTAAAK